MAEQISLRAELGRATGSRNSRRLRAEGGVPGIVYGKGRQPLAVAVDHHDLMVIIAHHGSNALISLETGSESILTIPKMVERHPYRNQIRHIDFVGVNLKEKVQTQVGVVLIGEPVGVREGGILTHATHQVMIEALPMDIPAHIDVDVSALGVGDSIRFEDVMADRSFEILEDPETVIASVVVPAVEVEPEPEEGEEIEGEEGEGEADGEGDESPAGESSEGAGDE